MISAKNSGFLRDVEEGVSATELLTCGDARMSSHYWAFKQKSIIDSGKVMVKVWPIVFHCCDPWARFSLLLQDFS